MILLTRLPFHMLPISLSTRACYIIEMLFLAELAELAPRMSRSLRNISIAASRRPVPGW